MRKDQKEGGHTLKLEMMGLKSPREGSMRSQACRRDSGVLWLLCLGVSMRAEAGSFLAQ